jgi:hypothetical protein
MHSFRRAWTIAAICVALGAPGAAAQAEKDGRPKLSLRASPRMGRSPLRVVFTAELTGGANDFEEYYCPTVEWEWGDGTESASTLDCEPYEAGKSEIRRRFTQQHTFKGGEHTVTFRLKRRDEQVAATTVQVQVQPGPRDMLDP